MEEGGFSGRLNPTAWVRALNCNSVYITRYRSMRVPVSIRTSYSMADKKALVDSGATNNFINPRFARRMRLGTKKLTQPRKIWNIDGTENKGGFLTEYIDLDVQTKDIHKEMRFLVTDLGEEDLILGYPWLSTFEPQITWKTATIDVTALPIVIRTVNPRIARMAPVIATLAAELTAAERYNIVHTLAEQSTIRTTATDLAISAQQYSKATSVPPEYQRHAKVFNEEEAQRFPQSRVWDHAIDLKPNAPDSLNCKIYPLSATERVSLREFLDEQVAKGYIRPSISPYASPFFFIKKKDGKLRPVQDYRALNKLTIRNNAPLPLIPQTIADLTNAFIFTKFDVRWGYNNVRIKDGDQWKAAFKTCYGLFEPTVMFFGLTNSPATFQAMMDHIFRPLIDKHAPMGTVIRVYMDDIIIGTSSTETNHTLAVHDVLNLLEEHDLFLKPEKCTFHAPRVDYLGVILEKGVTRMDPIKISGITNWPIPKKVKDVRSFLGFCNFYRAFIRGFAHLAKPLNKLTRKDAEWQWGPEEQKAFEALKDRVTSEPILTQPEPTEQFILEVDASGFAVGAVLLQRKSDNKLHPVGYFSATLNEAERNYDIYDLELLAIVKALRHWRALLAGSPHKIKVLSDHMNLQYWRQPQKISRRVAREVLELAEYDLEIHHLPGKANGRADALSRRPDYDQGEHDNENVTVLPDRLFIRAMRTSRIETPTPGEVISPAVMELSKPLYAQDAEVIKAWIDPHKLKNIYGTWYKDGRRVVTGGLEEKREIIKAHHDPPIHGHPGISRTTRLTERHHWWPGLRKDATEYVQGCADCQRHKINTRPTRAPLEPIYPKPEALPFETIALDFITKLPESQGCDSILTVTDHDCTKAVIFIPCREEISAEETAALFLQHVVVRFGLPSKMISDRDPRFASKFTRELCKLMGITQNISTAYHPRTDGQSERNNQWVEQYMREYVREHQDDWVPYIPLAEFAHNNWHSKMTRESPFFLLMGYNPRADWIDRPSPIPQVTLRAEQFKEARKRAQELMIKAQKSWVKHKDTPKYKIGDLVWLEGRHLRTNQPTAKLAPRRHGPFKVIQVMSAVNYRLELPTQWSIHPVFHIDLLTPYRETRMHGVNYQRPPPDLVNGEEEYEVEKILDSRRYGRGRKLQYLVKWKGYPDSENQWVNKDDVFADEAIREFKNSNSERETHIRVILAEEIPHSHLPPTLMTTTAFPHATIQLTERSDGRLDVETGASTDSYRDGVQDSSSGDEQTQTSDETSVSFYTEDGEHISAIPPAFPPGLSTPNGTPLATLSIADAYVPTIANSPTEEIPQEDSEADRCPPHPFLCYATHSCETSYETPALSDTLGNTIYAPTTQRPQLRVHEIQDDREVPLRLLETPPPFGFEFNRGSNFIPIRITDDKGQVWPARYVQPLLVADPMVLAIRDGDPRQFGFPLYATPDFDQSEMPRYSADDLIPFYNKDDPGMDEALEFINDKSLHAEVIRYRGLCRALETADAELERRIGIAERLRTEQRKCVMRLQLANAKERIDMQIDPRNLRNRLNCIQDWERQKVERAAARSGARA